jgi:hypothetical protein
MQCPECGYVMSPFDKDCARCRTLGRTPRTASPVVAASPALQQMDLSFGQDNPTGPPAAYRPPPPAQGLYSAPAPQSVYTPPPQGMYPSPSPLQAPNTPSSTAVKGSGTHHYNSNTVAGAAGISIIGVICILGRAARIYLAIDRLNHSRDQAETRSVNIAVPPFPSSQYNPATIQPQGYSYTATNRGIAPPPFAGTPQFGPLPAELAAQRTRDQMNQNLARVQQMQAESQQRMQQMQAENQQRMQQMQSQMRQNGFPRPGFGMPPTWPGR